MHPFYASPATAGKGFAAAVGCKKPEEEPNVQPECPDNSISDESLAENTRMVALFCAVSEEAGKEVMQLLASKGSEIITTEHIETAFSTVGALGGASSLLSVVQGNKLFAVQSAGTNSILRCSELGQIVNGLVTIPHSKGDVPGHTVLELKASDSFVILGATQLLEDFSQARLTTIFSENIEKGTADVAHALLKHTVSIEVADDLSVMVLDVRGWVALHNSGADASLTLNAIVDDGGAAANKAVDGAPATAAVPNGAAVNAGLANAAAGVTNATGDNATGTRDMPTQGDVAAGVASAAEGVKEGGVDTKGETGTKDGPKEEKVDPNAPWHTKLVGTAKKHWSTHKVSVMKFAKTRQKTANKDAKMLQGFFGKCGGGGKDSVLHEEDEASVPVPAVPE